MNVKGFIDEIDNEVRRANRYMICFKKGAEKLIIAYCHDKMIDDPGLLFKDWIPQGEQEFFMKYCHKRTGGRYKYIMFTVNFKDGIPLDCILKTTEKCLKKKWIENYLYCFETRNDQGEGIHLHLKCWIKEGKKPYDCKREVYNTFKHIVGNKMHVNCRYSNTDKCFEQYIIGMKKGEEKENYRYDRKWRKFNGLEDYYIMKV